MDVTPGFCILFPPELAASPVPSASSEDTRRCRNLHAWPRLLPTPHGPMSLGMLQDKRSYRNVRDYLVLIINYGLSCFRVWNRSQILHQGGQDISGNSNS